MYIINVSIHTSKRVYEYSHSNRSIARLKRYIDLLTESINDDTVIITHTIFKQVNKK